MSLFKENVWETNETGDKLTTELFSAKKKSKKIKKSSQNSTQSEKKLKNKSKKKTENLSKLEDNAERSGEQSSSKDKMKNNKKRKASEITIDESLIKKWKSESGFQGEKTIGKELNKKTNKLLDKSSLNELKKKVPKSIDVTTEKNSKARGKPDKPDKRKKLNGTNDDKKQVQGEKHSSSSNVMTKSQKRRLKNKLKALNGRNESQSDETLSKLNGQQHVESTDLKKSKKVDKSILKLERIKELLVNKGEQNSKTNRDSNEPKSLRDRMLERLKSSRFRYLNEQMYNSESWSSKKYFKDDPDAFLAYHEGYKLQVDQWPLNPLDTIIASIKQLPKDYVVADFGCGEARLAESVAQKVHSLDLVAINDKVTACDMAHTTLLTGRIDVVVFCLSLMGTNLTDYLIEANRVLRKDGILKIAEVESRFEDINEFVKMLTSYGFVNTWKDFSHDLFYFMDFKKNSDITKKRNKLPSITLKSCLYKRR